MLDAKKREELEAERRRAAMESENRVAELAVAERRRAAILDEEKRVAALKLRLEEQDRQAMPKTEPEQPEMEEAGEMDEAHLSAWLHYLTTLEDLEHALGPKGMSQLSDLVDLPPSYGGAGLQSLAAVTLSFNSVPDSSQSQSAGAPKHISG